MGNSAFAQLDDKLAVLETDFGIIVIELFTDDAPKHADNFIRLIESGFYDGVLFHRIIPGFMIQTGDPNTIAGDSDTWGSGGPGTTVDAEFNTITHNRGIVSMARTGDPNSAGSQFFIVHGNATFLDGQYTAFGRIVTEESFETLDKIASVEIDDKDKPVDPEQVRVTKITTVDRSEISNLIELDEPVRIVLPPPPTRIGNEKYESEKHQIKFSAPEGWTLQEPEKINPLVPDIVIVGPQIGDLPPNIALTIQENDQMTFDDVVLQNNKEIEELVKEGNLSVISQERTTVNDRQAYVTVAQGPFPFDEKIVIVMFKQTMIYDTEKSYKFLYASEQDNFDSQLPLFENAVTSFEILSTDTTTDPEIMIGDKDTETTDFSDTETMMENDTETMMENDTETMMENDTETMMENDTETMMENDTETMMENDTETMMDDKEGGGCLIATATYDSELAPQVQQLRELRDNTLLSTEVGTSFMSGFNQFYYSFSPTIADMERENPIFKEMVKLSITPLLSSLSILNHVEIDSEEEMLSFGIGIILMNIGMYFVAPTIVIYKIRK